MPALAGWNRAAHRTGSDRTRQASRGLASGRSGPRRRQRIRPAPEARTPWRPAEAAHGLAAPMRSPGLCAACRRTGDLAAQRGFPHTHAPSATPAMPRRAGEPRRRLCSPRRGGVRRPGSQLLRCCGAAWEGGPPKAGRPITHAGNAILHFRSGGRGRRVGVRCRARHFQLRYSPC